MPHINQSYGLTNPLQDVFAEPIIALRGPEATDSTFLIGQQWVDKSSNNVYFLTSITNGSANWMSATTVAPADISFSPFIVGPSGQAPFQTIQSALDAANAAGGGTVVVQDGTFTEDLTLFASVSIIGTSILDTIIIGSHTPPFAGSFSISNCTLQDAASIISTAVAGTGTLFFYDCRVNVANGTAFILTNWVGSLVVFNYTTTGTVDRFYTSQDSLTVIGNSSVLGAGISVSSNSLDGSAIITDCIIGCGMELEGTTNFSYVGCTFESLIECLGDSTGFIMGSYFDSNTGPSFFFSSSMDCTLSNCTLSSTNTFPINGNATAGKLGINNCSFTQKTTIASAVNIDVTQGGARSTFVQAKSIEVQESGTNDYMGVATLLGGTVLVSTTRVAANSRILLTSQVDGTGSEGFLRILSRTAGTSFTIASSSGSDNATVAWLILNPFTN